MQEQENQKLAELIKEYDERFCHILGYRRMTLWINHLTILVTDIAEYTGL